MPLPTNDKTGLINIKYYPNGYITNCNQGLESRAYYRREPYPYWAFQQWMLETLGPYPRCLPIESMCIDRAARWLFGKPIKFDFHGPSNIEKQLNQFYSINRMGSRLVSAAQSGMREGGLFIKFSLDPKATIPVRYQILKVADQVVFFYNPHDKEELLMVRIQYPFFNNIEGKWQLYREEWTADWEVHYIPVDVDIKDMSPTNPMLFRTNQNLWIEDSQQFVIDQNATQENKFGVIPGVHIKNIDDESEYGLGEFWKLHRIVDRINLAYHILDRSNQLDIDPITLFIDLEPKEGDVLNRPIQPGGVMDLKTRDGDLELGERIPQGKAQILENQGKMREHVRTYANDLMQFVFDAIGAVFPRQEHVTNKGAMTQSVLNNMFLPLLEVTNEKRKAYGENGICKLQSTIALALKNYGFSPFKSLKGVSSIFDEKIGCDITWFKQFEMTEDELFSEFDRLDREFKSGFITDEDAIKKVHQMEEIFLDETKLNLLKEEANEQRDSQKQDGGSNAGERNRGNSPTGEDSKRRKQQTRGDRVNDAK